ncbi:MAG: hypothetical protein NVS3B20_25650 [Polyangiales bacterium]
MLTVPPFPYPHGYSALSRGAPICFRRVLSERERDGLHFGEVAMLDRQLVTSGSIGYAMVVTGAGDSAREAQKEAYSLAAEVVIPNVRYRRDIGDRFLCEDHATLLRLGLMP